MLPSEPVILAARQCLPDAEALLEGSVTNLGFFNVGWYGTETSDERGAFGVVNPLGPLASHVGDFLQVTVAPRALTVYVIGSVQNLGADMAMTRATFLLLSRLTVDPLYALVGVVR